MKTVHFNYVKNFYSFDELINMRKRGEVSGNVVDRVRQKLIERLVGDDWWEESVETWKSALDQIGFVDADISFRLAYSQGDGASFTCKFVDPERAINFLSNTTVAKKSISFDGKEEDFRPWLVWKWHGEEGSTLHGEPQYARLHWVVNQFSDLRVIRHHRFGNYVHENTCVVVSDFRDPRYERHPRLSALVESFVNDLETIRKALSKAIYHDLDDYYTEATSDESLVEQASEYNLLFGTDGELYEEEESEDHDESHSDR